MAQYINKDAVLAEIERRKEKCDTFYDIALSNNVELAKVAIEEQKRQYDSLFSFIDTLEVEDVDINKEISQFIDANFEEATIGHKLSLRRTAKYFFELGLRASNPLTWEDVRDIMELYDEVTSMDYCNDIYEEVLKRFKVKKGE